MSAFSREGDLTAQTAWLRRLAGAIVRDDDLADDVSQATWLTVLRRPPRQAGQGWFARVVRSRTATTVKREAQRRAVEARVARSEAHEPSDDRLRLVDDLLAAVRSLDPTSQRIVMERYFEEATPTEIAVGLSMPASTVRTRLRRALRELRERLDDRYGRDAVLGLLVPIAAPPRRAALLSLAGAAVAKITGLLLLLVLLIAWIVGAFGGGPTGDPGFERSGLAETPGHTDPRRAAHREGPGDERGVPAPSIEDPPREDGTGAPAWRLTVRLAGDWPADGPPEVKISALEAKDVDDRDHRAGLGAMSYMATMRHGDGKHATGDTVTFDLGPIIERARRGIEEIGVTVEHPELLTLDDRVSTPGLLAGRGSPERHYQVTLPLRRATYVTGRLRDPRGGAVVKAHVGAFLLNRDGHPRFPGLDHVRTDEAGRFRLRMAGRERVMLVALADGFTPATRMLTGAPEGDVDMRLDVGASVRGRVAYADLGRRRAQVRARLCDVGHGFRLHRTELRSLGGGVVAREEVVAMAGEDRQYVLAGLGHGATYRLRLRMRDAPRHEQWAHLTSCEVQAPADGVDFDGAAASLVVRVPGPRAAVDVVDEDLVVSDRTRNGAAVFLLKPGQPLGLVVDSRQGWRARREVEPLADGERRVIVVEPDAPPTCRLVLDVRDPSDRPVPRCGAALIREGDRRPCWQQDLRREGDEPFAVGDLPAGTFRLVVRPGTWETGSTKLAGVEVGVTLRSGETSRVVVRPPHGGRLSLSVRRPRHVPAELLCRIHDANGRPVDVEFFEAGNPWKHRRDILIRRETNKVHPALAPGVYRVRIEAPGFLRWEERVIIDRDRITHVDVALEER